MVGITLSAELIHTAPPEVRRWLEQEIVRTLGLHPGHEPATKVAAAALIGCNLEEAREILSLIEGMLPVVSVFFELGREAASVPVHGMRAFRLTDILGHSRLHMPQQVTECLDVLSQVLRQVRGDGEAAFYALDDQGHCLIAEASMRSISQLWQEIVAQRALEDGEQKVPVPVQHSAPAEQSDGRAAHQRFGYAVKLPVVGR
jgi:hypothetical protein